MSDEYNDNTIVTFGKHQGKALVEVPASYLLWMYESEKGITNPKLLAYVEENYQALEQERNNN